MMIVAVIVVAFFFFDYKRKLDLHSEIERVESENVDQQEYFSALTNCFFNSDNEEDIEDLIENGEDPDACDQYGITPLTAHTYTLVRRFLYQLYQLDITESGYGGEVESCNDQELISILGFRHITLSIATLEEYINV